jgi:hypothetical protein
LNIDSRAAVDELMARASVSTGAGTMTQEQANRLLEIALFLCAKGETLENKVVADAIALTSGQFAGEFMRFDLRRRALSRLGICLEYFLHRSDKTHAVAISARLVALNSAAARADQFLP